MRGTLSRVLGLLLALFDFAISGVSGLSLLQRAEPAVVSFDIQRDTVRDPVYQDRLRQKRAKIIAQDLDNELTLYFCNISLGTPPQSLRLVLDTGSSDLWSNVPNSSLCSSHPGRCQASGTYNVGASSSYHFVSSRFNITYADGSGAAGDYVTDTLRIGGAAIDNFQFGVAYHSSSPQGVLGIGYVSNEVQVGRAHQNPYPNLPQSMAKNGLIKANAYSLWLNDLEANSGSILFGGVDSGKYHGQLETLPIQPVNGRYSAFIIALTGVSVNTPSGSRNITSAALPTAVLLDSGSSLTYLPDPVVQGLFSSLGVTYDRSQGVGFVPCGLSSQRINVTYTFSSPKITVGIDELVLDGGNVTFGDGTPACVFGVAPAGSSLAVLGDTFLRSAYVVYDLDNNEISLANTDFNSTSKHILEIGTGRGAVPGATLVANPVTTVAVGAGGPRIGGPLPTSTVKGAAARFATTSSRPSYALALAVGLFFSFLN